MTQPRPDSILEQIRKLAGDPQAGQLSDGALLERFAAWQDEVAFEALVRRHGPMILRLCRRLLHHWQDAEDVFQATFLVLARKARSIRKRESISSWLHGVAYRLAAKVRTRARQTAPPTLWPGEEPAQDLLADLSWREVRAVLDDELHRLPAKYQAPLLLHYLEGLTQEEAARRLGCSLSTLKRRLERGRELLRGRLTRRGVVPVAPLLLALLAEGQAPAGVPPALRDATVRAALVFAGGGEAAGVVSAPVRLLAGGFLNAMFQTKVKIVATLLLGVSVLGAGVVWHLRPAAASVPAEEAEAVAAPEDQPPEVYALVRLERAEPRLLNDAAPGRVPNDGDYELKKRTQAVLVKSRGVLGAVLRQPAIAKLPLVRQQRDPVGWLEKVLRVDSPNNAELLRIGMSGYKLEEMAALVNAVTEVYLKEFVQREQDARTQRLERLKIVQNEYRAKMQDRREALMNLRQAIAAADDATSALRQQVLVQGLLDCQRELRRLRLKEVSLRVTLQQSPGNQKALELQLAIRAEQEKTLREEEKQLLKQAKHVAEDQADIQTFERDINALSGFLKRLDAEVEQLRLESTAGLGRVTLLQKAEVPKGK
jgi:RNA polymerase sigma factor (sigma-70 family)